MPTIAPNTPTRKAPGAWAFFLTVLALALAFTFLAIATGPLLAQNAQVPAAQAPAGQTPAGEAPAQPAAEAGGEAPTGERTGGSPFSTTDLTPAPEPTPAPPPAPPAEPTTPSGGILGGSLGDGLGGLDLIKAMGAFIVVIVLLIIFLKVLAYLTHGRKMGKGGKTFTLKGTMLLDSRRYLAAVEIDGRMLVVGVTPDRLTSLGSWPLDSGDGRRLPDTFAFSDAIEGPKALGPPQAKAQGKAQAKASQAPAPKTQPVPQAPSQTRVPPAQPAASQTRVPATAVSSAASFADPGATPGPTLAANTGGPGLGPVPNAALGQEPTMAPTLGPNGGPNLGPGRKGAGLGADPRSLGGEGPVLDLSLDDAVFEGPESNDDFLKMFEDENDPKG